MVLYLQSQAEPIIFSSQTLNVIPVVKFDKHMYQDVNSSGHDDENWLKAYHEAMEERVDTDVTLEDEVLWYMGRLWVSNSVDLRKMILQEEHDSKVAGHMGQERQLNLYEETSFDPRWINGLKLCLLMF